ncbi:MAG: T9SS type A sorting domain-containing protein, partial [Bacteroidota bacterium]
GVNDYANDNVNSVPGQSHPWVLADMNGPLPVKLLSFDAKCNKNDVVISWSTATESNNDYFTLERSIDAENWQSITVIDGAGNSNEVLHYEFTDKGSYNGLSYYRLKQTDFDGKFEVFSPVSVVCNTDEQSDINIYPNPFKQEVIISYSNLMEGKGSVKVYDMLGNIVVDKMIELSQGSQNYVLDLSSLAGGLYDVGFASGNIEYHKRLVKN